MHLTTHPFASPKLPPTFAMTLRKYLSHARIVAIKQYDFDRIIEIETVRGEDANGLIIELFPPGNVILVNHEQKIILPLHPVTFRGRRIRSGEIYKLPEMQLNPVEITIDGLQEMFSESDTNLVKTLATRLNMGGIVAEEVCASAGVDKNIESSDLTDDLIRAVHEGIRDVFGQMDQPRPHIVRRGDDLLDVIPFEISRYADQDKRYFKTFNEALDEFFGAGREDEAIEEKAQKVVKNPLERRRTQQERAINKFEKEKSKLSTKAETIYMNYQPIDEMLALVRSEFENGCTWDEIRADHPTIKRTDPRERTIVLELGGLDIALAIAKNVPQNAQVYYDRSKKIGSKLNGARRALENTRELMEKKNEEIVKKYLEKRDIFMHTQAPGAPATIIKAEKGVPVPEQTIAEAAQFAISYSSVWKAGQYTGDCYWVHPDQVSKTPEHGEFVAKGAFIIRGKRNYQKDVRIGIAIGITEDMHLIGGPLSAVRKHAAHVIEIVPGRFNRDDLAKKIYRTFSESLGRSIKIFASPDQIVKFLPPGESGIKS